LHQLCANKDIKRLKIIEKQTDMLNFNPFKTTGNDINYGAAFLCPLYCLRYRGNSLGFLLLWLMFVLAPSILLFPNLSFPLAYLLEALPTIFVGILAGIYAPLTVKEGLTERKGSVPQSFYVEQRIWNILGAIIAIPALVGFIGCILVVIASLIF
jgi:hypothetical protein